MRSLLVAIILLFHATASAVTDETLEMKERWNLMSDAEKRQIIKNSPTLLEFYGIGLEEFRKSPACVALCGIVGANGGSAGGAAGALCGSFFCKTSP